MENGVKHKRRKFWIDPKLQFKYIAFNVIYLTVFAFLVGSGIYMSIWHSVTAEFSSARVDEKLQMVKRINEYSQVRTHQQAINSVPFLKDWAMMLSDHDKDLLNGILIRANRNLVPFFLIMIGIVVIVTILLSHRVAGPVFRLKRDVKTVAGGDLTVKFFLRETDELKDLASGIDSMVSGFASGTDQVKMLMEKAKSAKSDDERARCVEEAGQILSKYRTRK